MTDELHTLIGAYVLDALPADEVTAFREHLDRCATCRAEVAELQQVATRLGGRVAVAPPPELKARVLAHAERTAQLPPLAGGPGRRPRWAPWRPMLLVAAAAVLVVATGLGVWLNRGPSDDVSLAADVSAVFDSPDAHMADVDAVGAGTLHVALSRELGAVAVDTSELKPLPSDESYQMWLVENGTPHSGGVLDNLSSGRRMDIPSPGVLVAITIEPVGGSDEPTSAPIVVFDPESLNNA